MIKRSVLRRPKIYRLRRLGLRNQFFSCFPCVTFLGALSANKWIRRRDQRTPTVEGLPLRATGRCLRLTLQARRKLWSPSSAPRFTRRRRPRHRRLSSMRRPTRHCCARRPPCIGAVESMLPSARWTREACSPRRRTRRTAPHRLAPPLPRRRPRVTERPARARAGRPSRTIVMGVASARTLCAMPKCSCRTAEPDRLTECRGVRCGDLPTLPSAFHSNR